jgi:hypothetical protein
VSELTPFAVKQRPSATNDVAFATTELQTQPSFSSKRPLDATIVTLEAADVLADALFEEGLPRHELETEPALDHCEASADEAGDASEAPTDILAGIRWHVG